MTYSTPFARAPRKPLSYLERQRNAQAKIAARQYDAADPQKRLIRIMRAENVIVGEAKRDATSIWDAQNAPVALPRGLSREIHPQRAARLAEIIAAENWSDDPLAPLHPVPTVEEMLAELIGRSQRRFDAARDALARLEQGEDIDVDAVMAETDEPAPAADPVKRGRGRPPRMILDEDEPILPGQ